MQSTTFSRQFIKLSALVALCFTIYGFTAKLGLDSYEIYLNEKLLLKQFVNQPLSLRQLQLDKANDNDLLRIYYRHCSTPEVGTDRSIVIKDEGGNTLKEWTFPNAAAADLSMAIPVREVLQLKKKHAQHDLSIHYTARELSKGELLAHIRFK